MVSAAALENAELKDRIACELQIARERTLRLLEPLSDDELVRAVLAPDVAARVGPGAHRALRGALAAPPPGGRRADLPDERRRLRRVRASARGAPVARADSTLRPAGRIWRRCAHAYSTSSRGSSSTCPIRSSVAALSSASSSSTSSSTSRRCCRRSSFPGLVHEGGGTGRGRCGRAGRGGARRGRSVRARRRPPVGLRQRAARPRGRAAGVPDRLDAGDERRVRRVPGRRGLARAAPRLGARRRPVARAQVRAARADRGGTSPSSTSRGTRRMPSPAGPGGGCRPRPNGSTQPRSACSASVGEVWEWTVVRLRPPTPASRRSRTASTPRCSSGPSTRCCAARRGRRTRRSRGRASGTGTSPIRRQIFAGFRLARN